MQKKHTQLQFTSADIAYLSNANINIFEPYAPILHLGIQSIPGLKFYLNKNYFAPLFVNNSGLFEINLTNTFGLIGSIEFDRDNLAASLSQGYLLIDILYEGEG